MVLAFWFLLSFLLSCFPAFLSFLLSFLSLLIKMPRSKKGRISGGKRKEINKKRSLDAVGGKMEGISFARVTKLTGANHASVSIDTEHGCKEIRVRIPNILARRGATPITTRTVVAVETGRHFEPYDEKGVWQIKPADCFDIKAVLTNKQAYSLNKEGVIPSWMMTDISETDEAPKEGDGGFEFDYSAVKEGEESESDSDEEADIDAI